MSKKVGIMSFWTTEENYGQILQMWAICFSLKKLNYTPFIIRYDFESDFEIVPRSLSRRAKIIIKGLLSKLKPRGVRAKKFSKFKETHFEWSRNYKSIFQLQSTPPQAHAYVVGSDCVWSSYDLRQSYFLQFGDETIKKVAYAPSFGHTEISAEYRDALPKLLVPFSGVSSREEFGAELCRTAGRKDAQWLPDPSLLLNADDYRTLYNTESAGEPYVFAYLIRNNIDLSSNEIREFAKATTREFKYVTAHDRSDSEGAQPAGIEEWLGMMEGADCVITNSFHGCAFAIIYKKRFLYIPLADSKGASNLRAYSLLKRLGLEDRVYKGSLSQASEPIDYDAVYVKLNEWRNEAFEYLESVL